MGSAALAVRAMGLFLFVLAWQITTLFTPAVFLPSPLRVIDALIASPMPLVRAAAVTLGDMTIGYGVGTSCALVMGVGFGWWRRVGAAFEWPILVFSPIPIVTFIPLFIIWFGLGREPVLLCGALAAFFPSFLSAWGAVRNADKRLVEVATNFGAPYQVTMLRVVLPASIAHIVSGLKISGQMAFLITPVAEMIMGDIGLGGYIWRSADSFRTDQLVLGQLTLGFLGLLLYRLLDGIERRVAGRWQAKRLP